jgi:hypothetical protein
MPLCPPQIPHAPTRDRPRASAVRGLSHGTASLEWLKFAYASISRLHTFSSVVELSVISPNYVFPQIMLTTHYNCQPNVLTLTARLKLSSSGYLKQATSRCIFVLRQK